MRIAVIETMSNNTNDVFFELIRVSIGVQNSLSQIPSEKGWSKLYQMSEKQSLVGVCFAGLQRLGADADTGFSIIGMNKMQYLNWMGMAFSIQMRNEEVNRQCAELQTKLQSDELRSCLLKGQGVALAYGEQLSCLRQSGDIDVWVDATREMVIDYGMQITPNKGFDQKHMHYQCFEDTDVEAHWIPVKRNNPSWNCKLKKYFDSERERQFSNIVNGLCVPTTDFQLAHQLLHVYSHYVYEGVGMRQVMDLYFAQKACVAGRDKVLKLINDLGLMKFVAATQWVLQNVFMMPSEQFLCEPDAKEGQKLLNEIMIGGNFGQHDKRNHIKNETFLQRFFRRWGRMFRMIRFDPLGTILMPFMRLKLEIWMRKVRRKYGV